MLIKLNDLGLTRQLEVNLTNRIYDNTVIKRKGIAIMNYDTDNESVVIVLKIKQYSQVAGDNYGQYLGDKKGFRDESITITANNLSLVEAGFDPNEPDPTNPVYPYAAEAGNLLGKVSDLVINMETRELDPSLDGRNVMLEYDFYKFMAATQNVNIDNMIVNKVIENDQKEYDALYPQINP